ncbi:MAG: hypothetical protein EOP34_07060 [Rickettsiales bacterium]|nr:MAG: hypothetical protein EOP34_07060 [Rickettsiales bacterium]
MYNCYSIINKLFHCLRLSYKKKSDNFSLEDLLVNFNTKYFGPGVSKEEFYNFVLGFLSCLESLDILTFDKNLIKFNEIYSFDLKKAMYCSFDLMLLGSNNIYDTIATESCLTEEKMQSIYEIYKNSDEKIKMYIDDVLKCLVIATTVDKVSIYPEINNLLIELIFNNYLIEK